MLKLCLEKPDTVLRLILTFMGLEGKFPLLGSGFTTQLSAHSNEIHPKQRGSGSSSSARFCAGALNEIQPFVHDSIPALSGLDVKSLFKQLPA